jgi:hypothetical protein
MGAGRASAHIPDKGSFCAAFFKKRLLAQRSPDLLEHAGALANSGESFDNVLSNIKDLTPCLKCAEPGPL